ncbi:MAG: DUF4136 domain-containing protein [Halioglobus sp.]
MYSRAFQAVFTILLLSLVTACATPLEATMDHDSSFDFTGIRKISIQPVDRKDLSSLHISDMQEARIDQALADELQRKGFEIVGDNAEADLYMIWHLVTEERTDVRTYNSMSYYNCWGCGPSVSDVSVRQYTQGTFIVDMIDPMRNKSVWRSIIESRLSSQPEDAATLAEARREAATAVFAEFPPN